MFHVWASEAMYGYRHALELFREDFRKKVPN